MASRLREEDVEDDRQLSIRALISAAKRALLKPITPFVSRAALKAYLTTILLISTAFILLGAAIAAYTVFYLSYIPRIGFERTIHLQFDSVYKSHNALQTNAHPYPYGTASLAPDIVSAQGYDVWVELAMPRTQDNQDAGNFMLEVNMYAPEGKGSGTLANGNIIAPFRAAISSTSSTPDTSLLLATSRRPAILPYRSRYVELMHKLTELHWYLLGFRSEDDKLRVPMFERVTFAKGSQRVPSTVRLELQSTHTLQVYNAKVLFCARFRGLRWLMYNHRIISALVFIPAFWTTEVVFMAVAWLVLAFILRKTDEYDAEAKSEQVHEAATAAEQAKPEDDDEEGDFKPLLSDTERTFPTLSTQQALHYSSPAPDVKAEPQDDSPIMIPDIAAAKAADADVEDEDEDEDMDFFDSGIGTSLESSGPARRESMRRRRGRPGSSGSARAGESASILQSRDDGRQ